MYKTCRKVYIGIRCISSICHLLSIDARNTLLSAFVLPKLDYCNFIFYCRQKYMLERLKKVQSSAARLIFQCYKQNHISPHLMSLHWLPIIAPIEYKLSVICHSLILACHIIICLISQSMHRKETYALLLTIEFYAYLNCEQRIWHRSFSFAAPTIWNSLPSELRYTDYIQKFKSALKTFDLDVNHYI